MGHRVEDADEPKSLISLCATCHEIVTLLAGNAKSLVENPRLLKKAVELAKIHINALA